MKSKFQTGDRVKSSNGAKGVVTWTDGIFCTVEWKRRFTNAKRSVSLPARIKGNTVLTLDTTPRHKR